MTRTAMQPFVYRGGQLFAEDVAVAEVAAAVGTPVYIYSASAMESTYRRFAGALADAGLDATICYAVKANPHLAVISTFGRLGAGADVVSEGELRRALAVGISGDRIVFAGVGKTAKEMALGLDAGILQFNVESQAELLELDRVARERGRQAPVALRINPDVDARTHAKITTGRSENKFGIDLGHIDEVLRLALDLPGIALEGLAVHIGSQLTEIAPYASAFAKVGQLFTELRAAGHGLRRLDLGGGLGIPYHDETPPSVEDYAATVRRSVGELGVPLIFEPGRHLVGQAGLLLTRTLYVKDGTSRRFVIVDAAMNDLIRPSLYDAWHEIRPVSEAAPDSSVAPVDVVGPICESGDVLAEQRPLPPVAAGDLLAILSTGAYGATMASSYNSRPPAPEVMVRGDRWAVITERADHESLMARDRLPDWLQMARA